MSNRVDGIPSRSMIFYCSIASQQWLTECYLTQLYVRPCVLMKEVGISMTNRIHVIGGGGGMGRWLIENIFGKPFFVGSAHANTVYCYDTSAVFLSTLPDHVEGTHVTSVSDYQGYADRFLRGDIFVIATPPDAVDQTIQSLMAAICHPSTFITISSLQTFTLDIFRKFIRPPNTYLGFHPLFGPNVRSVAGQVAALVDFDDANSAHISFKSIIDRSGLFTSQMSSKEHDNYMSIIQALTQFCLIGFIHTILKNPGLKICDLMAMRTPNFQFLYLQAVLCGKPLRRRA